VRWLPALKHIAHRPLVIEESARAVVVPAQDPVPMHIKVDIPVQFTVTQRKVVAQCVGSLEALGWKLSTLTLQP